MLDSLVYFSSLKNCEKQFIAYRLRLKTFYAFFVLDNTYSNSFTLFSKDSPKHEDFDFLEKEIEENELFLFHIKNNTNVILVLVFHHVEMTPIL